MDSNGLPYTHYGQPFDQDFPLDPNLYQDDPYNSGAGPSTSSAQPYPQENDSTGSTSTAVDPRPFKCNFCGKDYRRQCDLVKHSNNHTKRRQCPVEGCEGGGAERKDLYRHLWAHHSVYAYENNIPKDEDQCGFPGCEYRGRKDNLKRHRDSHNHWMTQS